MDQRPLVTEKIEAGATLLNELVKLIPLTAAFWLKQTEDDNWILYFACEDLNSTAPNRYDEEFRRLRWELRDPNMESVSIRLDNGDHPIVHVIKDVWKRYPNYKKPIRLDEVRDKGVYAEGLYIYPPPMALGQPVSSGTVESTANAPTP